MLNSLGSKYYSAIYHKVDVLPNANFQIYKPISEKECVEKLIKNEIQRKDVFNCDFITTCQRSCCKNNDKNQKSCVCNRKFDRKYEPALYTPLNIKLATIKYAKKNEKIGRAVDGAEKAFATDTQPKSDKCIKIKKPVFLLPPKVEEIHNALQDNKYFFNIEQIKLAKALMPNQIYDNGDILVVSKLEVNQILKSIKLNFKNNEPISYKGQILLRAIAYNFKDKKIKTKYEIPRKVFKLIETLRDAKELDNDDIALGKLLIADHFASSFEIDDENVRKKFTNLSNALRCVSPLSTENYNIAKSLGILPSLFTDECESSCCLENDISKIKETNQKCPKTLCEYDRLKRLEDENNSLLNYKPAHLIENRFLNIPKSVRQTIKKCKGYVNQNKYWTNFAEEYCYLDRKLKMTKQHLKLLENKLKT